MGKEKAMAPHSSTLAWKIPWTEEPDRLHSMGSWRIGHNWATSLSLFTFMHWRTRWQPTPVFLPGESQGRGSLVGCRLVGSHRVGYDWSDLATVAAARWGMKGKFRLRIETSYPTSITDLCNSNSNHFSPKCCGEDKVRGCLYRAEHRIEVQQLEALCCCWWLRVGFGRTQGWKDMFRTNL